MRHIDRVPDVTFKMRERDDSIGGDNPFKWVDRTTSDLFDKRKILLFALPGAFTPTCSTFQLPKFEELYDDFLDMGFDDIYCLSVNDAFVMYQWGKQQGVENVKLIPDGNGEFTKEMGMLVSKENLGFGARSWRYAAIVDDGWIESIFIEGGKCHNAEEDPYEVSDPEYILRVLMSNSK